MTLPSKGDIIIHPHPEHGLVLTLLMSSPTTPFQSITLSPIALCPSVLYAFNYANIEFPTRFIHLNSPLP